MRRFFGLLPTPGCVNNNSSVNLGTIAPMGTTTILRKMTIFLQRRDSLEAPLRIL